MHNQFLLLLCIFSCVSPFGCSVPKMMLNHENQIAHTYETMDSIRIVLFQDNRPDEERIEYQTAVNSLSPQIWSGLTSPEMMLFVQNSLVEEANRSHLFVVSDEAELELSGYVNSMKVDRRVTFWRYAAIIPLTIGILASEPGDLTNLWIGAGVSLIFSSLDFPILTATVDYHAIIKRNGIQIFETDIKLQKEDKYSSWSEWGWQDVSIMASKVLDQAITESISMLYEEISSTNL